MNTVTLTQKQYDAYVEIARKVNKNTDTKNILHLGRKFTSRSMIPTVEDLETHNVRDHVAEWLPYLIYYREKMYTPPEGAEEERKEYKRTVTFLTRLFDEAVDIKEEDIPEEDLSDIIEKYSGKE